VSDFLDKIVDQLNLSWAWEKVRREAKPGDTWFDEIELAGFELELERNLQSIAMDFRRKQYRLAPLKPMPFPKSSNKDGTPCVRQIFQVAIRDQVAWTAVVNVVGPYVDNKMPAWSYGNRLYRSIWVEEDDNGKKQRKIGRYRHASGRLYLPFGQSWPIFKRHVFLATRAMTNHSNKPLETDEQTQEEYELQGKLNEKHRCPFVLPAYWQYRRPQNGEDELYWCSIDLKKFYPNLNLKVIQDNIVEQLPPEWQSEAKNLLKSMLRFQLDLKEWDNDYLTQMDIKPGTQIYTHVPTGLYVSGFLANAGLLKVDFEVTKLFANKNVAHFRFVDDHIILAYSFNALEDWVNKYKAILDSSGTGAQINSKKIEPEEFSNFFIKDQRKRKGQTFESTRKAAEKACKLDPQFPSPLMTKTLALVSSIARTDFDLLDPVELTALTQQLEHLLLTDLPEKEMHEKTRLSFAATRLMRMAECRLANDEIQATSVCKREAHKTELGKKNIAEDKRQYLEQAIVKLDKEIEQNKERLVQEVDRTFQLLRKVLHEKPDKVRLWAQAVRMCRLTGVREGLKNLLHDINQENKKNPLAAEYLHANMLALLGSQSLIAARIVSDEEAAHWRRDAARAFLEEILKTGIEAPKENSRWFLRVSWQQYCFGIYCASLVLKTEPMAEQTQPNLNFPDELMNIGKECQEKGSIGHSPAQWIWWATRMTLMDLAPQANKFVKHLAEPLQPSRDANAFWRFFPLDVPIPILQNMIQEKFDPRNSIKLMGWWYDALRKGPEIAKSLAAPVRRIEIGRVKRALNYDRHKTVSLYEWCDYLKALPTETITDPRSGEWTALEIVRQIASLIVDKPVLNNRYINETRRNKGNFQWIHPANFRIPIEWLKENELTWEKWQNLIYTKKGDSSINYLPKLNRIVDSRYTPLSSDNPLFMSVNPIRGLGLLLYGLLKKSFNLPSIWNGPRHADVLGMLSKLLLEEVTCSSWTLGVLQGCLQPRATENMFLKTLETQYLIQNLDDDTLHDPVYFQGVEHVIKALEKCQDMLKHHQLSTLENKARQLTPLNIRQLTEPEWNKVFAFSPDQEIINE